MVNSVGMTTAKVGTYNFQQLTEFSHQLMDSYTLVVQIA